MRNNIIIIIFHIINCDFRFVYMFILTRDSVQAQREIEYEGSIYPPFMVLEYGQITNENISSNEVFPVTFTAEFYMENDILHYVDVRSPS